MLPVQARAYARYANRNKHETDKLTQLCHFEDHNARARMAPHTFTGRSSVGPVRFVVVQVLGIEASYRYTCTVQYNSVLHQVQWNSKIQYCNNVPPVSMLIGSNRALHTCTHSQDQGGDRHGMTTQPTFNGSCSLRRTPVVPGRYGVSAASSICYRYLPVVHLVVHSFFTIVTYQKAIPTSNTLSFLFQ